MKRQSVMGNFKISVIVPAYNVAAWIPRCMDSILRQTYTNLEIIAIDDGATDDSGKIIDQYAEKDPRVIAVHKKNEGLVALRETGIQLATGDYVGFVDGDDEIVPDFYQRLLNNAVQYNADISHCGMEYCFYDGRVINHGNTGKFLVMHHEEGLAALLEGNIVEPSLCNKLYKKELLPSSCLDPDIVNNEDLLRNFILFSRAKVSVYDDFCGYKYWRRGESMSNNSNSEATAEQVLKARRQILNNSDNDIYQYAASSLLKALVATINTFSDSTHREQYLKYRRQLIDMKKNIQYLPKKERIIALMIVYVPGVHKAFYHTNQVRKRWKKKFL